MPGHRAPCALKDSLEGCHDLSRLSGVRGVKVLAERRQMGPTQPPSALGSPCLMAATPDWECVRLVGARCTLRMIGRPLTAQRVCLGVPVVRTSSARCAWSLSMIVSQIGDRHIHQTNWAADSVDLGSIARFATSANNRVPDRS